MSLIFWFMCTNKNTKHVSTRTVIHIRYTLRQKVPNTLHF